MITEIKRKLFTVAEYHKMIDAGIFHEDDRIELLGGEILHMSPIGTRHAACVKRLIQLFTSQFGKRVIVSAQDPIELSYISEPQPDFVLLKPRADFYSQAHPKPKDIYLLVEVSDTTVAYDRRVKIPFYAQAGIFEVWLIDVDQETIEVYRKPSAQGYAEQKIIKRDESLAVQAFSDIQFNANEILG